MRSINQERDLERVAGIISRTWLVLGEGKGNKRRNKGDRKTFGVSNPIPRLGISIDEIFDRGEKHSISFHPLFSP